MHREQLARRAVDAERLVHDRTAIEVGLRIPVFVQQPRQIDKAAARPRAQRVPQRPAAPIVPTHLAAVFTGGREQQVGALLEVPHGDLAVDGDRQAHR